MEVLHSYDNAATHWGLTGVLILATIVVLAFWCTGVGIAAKDGADSSGLAALVGVGLIAAFMVFLILTAIHKGPTTYHKVKISDFNEVYEQGYEITDRDGRIYTITKVGSD